MPPVWALWVSPDAAEWESEAAFAVEEALETAVETQPGERGPAHASVRWLRDDTVIGERLAGPLAAPDWNGPELDRASDGGRGTSCAWAHGRFRCAAAEARPDGVVVQVVLTAAGANVALWEHRQTLFGLAAVGLLAGGALASWLVWLVRPVAALRDAVVARARRPRRPELLRWRRNDEIGDLADAVDTLLAAVHARDVAAADAAADLVHELRNPTAAVAAAADLLAASSDPVVLRAARALDDAARRLDAVSRDYLSLARAEAEEPAQGPIDVAALLSGVVEATRTDPRAAALRVDLRCGPLPAVQGNAAGLETALRNVLANAVVHAQRSITVDAGADGDVVHLAIANDGEPVDAAALREAFARWSSRRAGGTGLGLPIARAHVEALGGTRTARPRPEGGAIFELHLPVRCGPDPLAGPSDGGSP